MLQLHVTQVGSYRLPESAMWQQVLSPCLCPRKLFRFSHYFQGLINVFLQETRAPAGSALLYDPDTPRGQSPCPGAKGRGSRWDLEDAPAVELAVQTLLSLGKLLHGSFPWVCPLRVGDVMCGTRIPPASRRLAQEGGTKVFARTANFGSVAFKDSEQRVSKKTLGVSPARRVTPPPWEELCRLALTPNRLQFGPS